MEGTMEQPSNPAARENTHKHTLCPTHSSFRTHHTQNSPTPWVKNLSFSVSVYMSGCLSVCLSLVPSVSLFDGSFPCHHYLCISLTHFVCNPSSHSLSLSISTLPSPSPSPHCPLHLHTALSISISTLPSPSPSPHCRSEEHTSELQS